MSGGRSEVNFETNVDQDISALAARTHAEQSGSSASGRRRMQSQQDGEAPRSGLVTGVTSLERAAQGRSGLQTVGLDLGVLGARNNVDDEIRTSAASGGGIVGGSAGGSRSSSSSYNTQHSAGGRQSSSSSSGHGYTQSSQTGGGYQQYSDENNNNADEYGTEEDYDENEDEQGQSGSQHGGQGGSSWSRSSSYSLSHKRPLNAQPGSVDQQFKHYPHKRDVSDQNPESPCKSTNCGVIRCVVGPIDKNNGALVALRTRLVAQTLHKVILVQCLEN